MNFEEETEDRLDALVGCGFDREVWPIRAQALLSALTKKVRRLENRVEELGELLDSTRNTVFHAGEY